MAESTSTTKQPRASRGAFKPAGTATQQRWNMTGLSRAYRIEANRLRRKAELFDRRASVIDEARGAEQPITWQQVSDAVTSGSFQARYRGCRLAGISPLLPRREAVDALCALKWPATRTPAKTNESSPSAIAQAVAIVDELAKRKPE